MEKIIKFGKDKGYEIRVEPEYCYKFLEVNRNNFSFNEVYGSRKLDDKSLIIRILKSFKVLIKAGDLDKGGYWKYIFKIENRLGYGYVLYRSSGDGFKYFKKSLRGFLAGKGKPGISGLYDYIKIPLEFNMYKDYLNHLDYKILPSISFVQKKIAVSSLLDDTLIFPTNGYIDLSFDILNIRRYGFDSDKVSWINEKCYFESDHNHQLHSISINNLFEMGVESYIRDKKLEKLFL